jgi:dUTP pyrophosphatase
MDYDNDKLITFDPFEAYSGIIRNYEHINQYLCIRDLINIIRSVRDIDDNNLVIKYAYTNDEYGEAARELHKTRPLQKAYPGDAGIDLPIVLNSSDRKHGKKVIWPGEREMLHTGIAIELPPGYFGRIVHRSSTEKVFRLRVVEGIIDTGFRGPIFSHVFNGNTCQAEVSHGDRLAQLIPTKIVQCQLTNVDKLSDSERSTKGWGSSGK